MMILRDLLSRRHGACGCTRQGAARLERGWRIVNLLREGLSAPDEGRQKVRYCEPRDQPAVAQ